MREEDWQALRQTVRAHRFRQAWHRLLDAALLMRGAVMNEAVAALDAWDALPQGQTQAAQGGDGFALAEGTPAHEQLLLALTDRLQQAAGAENWPQPEGAYIHAQGLTKRYRKSGGFELGPVSLSVRSGEIAGLVGENGNGKTTLLRLLAADLQPGGGSVDYGIPQKDRYALRTRLAYIPQRPLKWGGRVMTQLQFTASSYGVPPTENLPTVELLVARLGLRRFRHLNWRQLSSGYKMRFELARALLQRPAILLLDEPLANLDINAQQTLLSDLRELVQLPWQPMALVMSSQQLYEVEKIATQVLFLENGKPRDLRQSFDGQGAAVEFETTWSAQALHAWCETLPPHALVQNGQTWILTFANGDTQLDHFLACAVRDGVPLGYYRDITHSTRRLFVRGDAS